MTLFHQLDVAGRAGQDHAQALVGTFLLHLPQKAHGVHILQIATQQNKVHLGATFQKAQGTAPGLKGIHNLITVHIQQAVQGLQHNGVGINQHDVFHCLPHLFSIAFFHVKLPTIYLFPAQCGTVQCLWPLGRIIA